MIFKSPFLIYEMGSGIQPDKSEPVALLGVLAAHGRKDDVVFGIREFEHDIGLPQVGTPRKIQCF